MSAPARESNMRKPQPDKRKKDAESSDEEDIFDDNQDMKNLRDFQNKRGRASIEVGDLMLEMGEIIHDERRRSGGSSTNVEGMLKSRNEAEQDAESEEEREMKNPSPLPILASASSGKSAVFKPLVKPSQTTQNSY